MLPSRNAFLAAFFGVVVAGVLGGIIGYGVGDVMSSGDAAARFAGTIVGAVGAAAGVGIVAVLVLRAMAEWRRQLSREPRAKP
jgi:hypothetical protein